MIATTKLTPTLNPSILQLLTLHEFSSETKTAERVVAGTLSSFLVIPN